MAMCERSTSHLEIYQKILGLSRILLGFAVIGREGDRREQTHPRPLTWRAAQRGQPRVTTGKSRLIQAQLLS